MASKNGGGGRANRPTFTDQEALLFHSQGRPGKLEVVATKPMATQRDLSLAYSPGVAVPVLAIAEDESKAYDYTTKGNFVAVITNGTAILGLGNRGALAAKPVMEGKAVLFKRFASIPRASPESSRLPPPSHSRPSSTSRWPIRPVWRFPASPSRRTRRSPMI